MSYLGAQNSIALGVQGLIHIDTGVVGSADYLLAKSLRFRSSATLSRTPATTTNQKTWTWSSWIKRGTISTGTAQRIFNVDSSPSGGPSGIWFNGTTDTLNVPFSDDSGNSYGATTTAVFRDPAAWYHVTVACDTTQTTNTDRVKIYVNGVIQATTGYGTGYPPLNYNGLINLNRLTLIGQVISVQYYDGELAEVNFVDGYPTGVTSGTWAATNVSTIFGASSTYNQWLPIKYAGTYGTNGFYLPFTNTTSTSTLVADSSGNGNNWTPNNISLTAGSTYDSLTDVPTLTSTTVANYCVLNPLSTGRPISAGNLQYGGSTTGIVKGTIAVTTGKWYFEFQWTGTAGPGAQIGIALSSTSPTTTYLGSTGATGTTGYGYYSSNGNKYSGSGGVAYGASYTTSDVIGVALDLTAGTLTYYKNNVSQGVAFTGLVGEFTPAAGSDGTNDTGGFNFGQQPFTYTPPTGFLPLNTFNIAAGTVTTSGTFTGNASTDGPMVWLNGTPTAMTINGNAVTFGTHADKLANGFKVRSSSASYNASGSNTYVATTVGAVFKYEDAQSNP